MEKLPKHITTALLNNHTSLGDHPCFPPEDEEKFVIHLLTKYYNGLLEDVGTTDIHKLKTELSKLLSAAIKYERDNQQALEKLCAKIVTDLFNIPENTIDIHVTLTNDIDTSSQRMFPERTEDFSFENIKDMNDTGDEIYKRRLLNSLIAGAAIYYASDVSLYVQELFKIDPELPFIYKKILLINNLLLYLNQDDEKEETEDTEGGVVDVTITSIDEMPIIDAKAIIFPILLEETIKGIFELVISHGLPDDKDKAQYIMKKADFKFAENWDLRLGMPLYELLLNQIDDDIEPTFLFYELSKMEVSVFNEKMREVFGHTKSGKRFLDKLTTNIEKKKKLDDFEDYIQVMNNRYPVEDGVFTSDEFLEL